MFQGQYGESAGNNTHTPHCHFEPLRVGLLGLGNVGGGTYRVLRRNQRLIAARAGRDIHVAMASVRNLERAGAQLDGDVTLVQDPFAVVRHPDIDVVVEAIGGISPARKLVLEAIAKGKHVVTANKALLAEHGGEIFAAAQAAGVVVAYEGAVAVSIPIIKALREGLTANRIAWIAGIINGTTNYVLSKMVQEGASFIDALKDAQRRGYAEADPTLDVSGVDAAHKLALLAANAFGAPIAFDKISVEGITALETADLALALRLGYSTKLLGLAIRRADGLELRVQPMLVPSEHLLAQVHGSMNGIMVNGDAAGVTMYYGAGAGAEQTASAVIADLVDLCRSASIPPNLRVPLVGFQPEAVNAIPVLPMADVIGHHYVRLDVADPEGFVPVLQEWLARRGVTVQQRAIATHSVALILAPIRDSALRRLVGELQSWPIVMGSLKTLPILSLELICRASPDYSAEGV